MAETAPYSSGLGSIWDAIDRRVRQNAQAVLERNARLRAMREAGPSALADVEGNMPSMSYDPERILNRARFGQNLADIDARGLPVPEFLRSSGQPVRLDIGARESAPMPETGGMPGLPPGMGSPDAVGLMGNQGPQFEEGLPPGEVVPLSMPMGGDGDGLPPASGPSARGRVQSRMRPVGIVAVQEPVGPGGPPPDVGGGAMPGDPIQAPAADSGMGGAGPGDMTPNAARTLAGDYDAPVGLGGAARSPVQDTIDALTKAGEITDYDRGMALARAGFAAMASRNPSALGALGEAGQAGLKDYQEVKQRALESRAKAAGLSLSEMQRAETERSNRAREGISDRGLTLQDQQRKDALEARREDAKARSEDRRLSIEERAAARREAAQLQVQIAQIGADARRDVAEASRYGSQMQPGKGKDEDGNIVDGVYVMDQKLGRAVFQPGVALTGKPGGGKPSVYEQRKADLKAAGYSDQEIAEFAAGKRQPSATDRVARATAAARAKSALETNPSEARRVYDETYKTIYDLLGPASAPAAPDAPAAAPVAPRATAPLALPADRTKLQEGTVYSTARGPARYIGNGQFEPIR